MLSIIRGYILAITSSVKVLPVPFLAEHQAMQAYWGVEA
jgi:hypothetical protein